MLDPAGDAMKTSISTSTKTNEEGVNVPIPDRDDREEEEDGFHLWGDHVQRTKFTLIGLMTFCDGFFMWLNCGIYTLHMYKSGFSAGFIALVYAVGQLCRMTAPIVSRWHVWWLPVLLVLFATVAVLPSVFRPQSSIAMWGLAVSRVGDLLPFMYVQLGLLVKEIGGKAIVAERRSQHGSSVVTATWVIGYSVATVIAGFMYEYIGLVPIVTLQSIGLLANAIFRVVVHFSPYSFEGKERATPKERDHPVPVSSTTESAAVKQTKRSFSSLLCGRTFSVDYPLVLWSFVFLVCFFHISPVAVWINFAKLYQDRFGLNTGFSCVIQMLGDVLGSGWIMYKGHLRKTRKVNRRSTRCPEKREEGLLSRTIHTPSRRLIQVVSRLWCFRTPRDVSSNLFFLAISLAMMTSHNLPTVIVGHIAVGIFYVVLSQNASTGLLIYCQDSRLSKTESVATHKRLNAMQMALVMITKVVGAAIVPPLYVENEAFPFLAAAGVALIGGVAMAYVFMMRIHDRFNNAKHRESYTRLSKSLYKLEAMTWDEEIRARKDIEMLGNVYVPSKSALVDIIEPLDDVVDDGVGADDGDVSVVPMSTPSREDPPLGSLSD